MPGTISKLAALAVLLAALVAPGCGGGDGDRSITKAEFIEKGDAICRRTDRTQIEEFKRYGKAHQKSLSGVPIEKVNRLLIMKIGLPSVVREVEELEALGIPQGDRAAKTLMAEMREAVKKAEQAPLKVESSSNPFLAVEKPAARYGFKKCSELI